MFSFAKRVAEGYRNGRSCCVNFVIHGRNLEIMLGSVRAVGNDPGRRCTREATRRKALMCCLGLCLQGCGGDWRIFRSHVCDGINVHRGREPSNHGMSRQVGGGGVVQPVFKMLLYNSRLPHMITCYALPKCRRPVRCGGNGAVVTLRCGDCSCGDCSYCAPLRHRLTR